MIGPWLETQPERVRSVLDPSWSPVRAAVVLAARHEQEAVRELDGFVLDGRAAADELAENLQVSEGAHEYSQGVLGSVIEENESLRGRITQLEVDLKWAEVEIAGAEGKIDGRNDLIEALQADFLGYRLRIARALGMTYQADGHAEQPCSDDEADGSILDLNDRIAQLEEELARLKTELATARAAMGPLGTPPLPPVDPEADANLREYLTQLQACETFEPLTAQLPNDPRLP